MPELPEVETVKRGLEPTLTGARIIKAHVFREDLRVKLPTNYAQWLKNRQIQRLSRRGKYLCIHLDNNKTIIFHLGMSGSLTIGKEGQNRRKHDHIVLEIENSEGKNIQIFFHDPRRFGLSDVIDTPLLDECKYFSNLGVEPLSDKFNGEYLYDIFHKSQTNIKNAIMNSSKVAGIGNIYACEALFDSRIHPETPCNKLKLEDFNLLSKNCKTVLKKAIKAGGSSLKDHRKSDGTLGYFQHNFKIYGREELPCSVCGSEILNVKISNRSSFFCPKCQPKNK